MSGINGDPAAAAAAAALDPSQSTATPEPAAAEAAPPNPGPWAGDLEQRFTDAEQRAAVDQYLREVVQPRMTQLEQRPDLPEGASKLWNDLSGENYAEAFLSLAGELFDDDVANEFLGLLTTRYGEQEPEATAPPAEAAPAEAQPAALPPEIQNIVAREQQREYKERVDVALKGDPKKNVAPIPPEFHQLIHPLVVATNGDIEAAAAGLRQQLESAGVMGQGPSPEDVPDPPATLTGATPPAVPTQKKQTMDEAIHDFWNEQKKQAPPPVGSV